MDYSVIILCAGSGTRTGLTYNKMFYKIDNVTVYEKTLAVFLQDIQCKQIIVVTKEEEINDIKSIIKDEKICYVIGGKERQDSVYSGLQVVTSPYVLIHDGARPYIEKMQIEALLECLKEHKACLLMVPCKDTIKVVREGKVKQTLPRETLMQAQTPQAFMTEVIKEAYQKAKEQGYHATDDASLVEVFSKEAVYAVLGSYQNTKITTKADL